MSLMDAHGPLTGVKIPVLTGSPDTLNDKWYLSQRREIRTLRGRRFANQEAWMIVQFLVSKGVVAQQDFDTYLKIIGYNWDPEFMFDAEYIESLPRAKDLIVKAKPFTWPNQQADSDPANKDAIGTTYNPDEHADIGAIWEPENVAPPQRYEKLLLRPRTTSINATADWSADIDGSMIPYWIRVA